MSTEKKVDATTALYLGDWSSKGRDGLIYDFNSYGESIDFTEGYQVLLAYYVYENYLGDAFVLLSKDGKLYEVNGSHCSCYGLEGQWEPEETNIEALTHRLEAGQLGTYYGSGNTFAVELRDVLACVGGAP